MLAREPVAQRLALDVGHGEPEEAGRLARVMHRQDMGVLQPGYRLDLAQKAVGAERGRQLGMEHLQGDRPLVLEVAGEVDGGHAAPTELSLDLVAVTKGGPKASSGIVQMAVREPPSLG